MCLTNNFFSIIKQHYDKTNPFQTKFVNTITRLLEDCECNNSHINISDIFVGPPHVVLIDTVKEANQYTSPHRYDTLIPKN